MFKKTSTKLILAVGIATIIIIMVFSYINVRAQSSVLLSEVERHANQLSETIKSGTKYAMLLNHREQISETIKTIGAQEFIQEIRIFDKEGVNIYSSDLDSVGTMVDKKAEACYVCHSADQPLEHLDISERTRIYRSDPGSPRVLGIINAIYNEKSCWEAACHAHDSEKRVLGVLDITVSLDSIDKQISLAKFKMLIFALVAIIAISSVLWFFVWRLVEKPVNELVDATKNVADGNLNYTITDLGSGELGLLARSFNNMTNRLSEARKQLFQSDKMASLGKLAAGVAHEINNPLTGILTYSSFLLKRTKDNPEIQEDLSVIVRETKRSREIVKGLLDFARQSIPKKNDVNINELIVKALKVVENQLSISQVQVVNEFDEELPNVVVDANQLVQVFINLVVNAKDAIGKEGGKITISTALIHLDPFGVTQVKNALCPKGHSLMDNAVKIDGMPTIKVKTVIDKNEGYINVDPIYGRHRNNYGIKLEKNKEIAVSCSKCNISLLKKEKKCPECGAPQYTLEIPGKGQLHGCCRKDCYWQHWEVVEKEGRKEFVQIKIRDTGCGIEKDKLSQIYDPFFTTKGQKGTGLGLAVIWGIVNNHNGTISVDTEVGQGTTFTINLPSARSRQRAA
jgi:two-component system NtrC family sensor kinase